MFRTSVRHAAHRVGDGADPSTEALLVAGQPPHDAGDGEEDQIQERRVVPGEMRRLHPDGVVDGDGPERPEHELGDQTGDHHQDVEETDQSDGEPPSVELPVDEDQGHGDEIGEDEGDHASEADAAAPERSGQGDVADRADEAGDRDRGSDQGTPERLYRSRRGGQEEVGEGGVWDLGDEARQ